MKDDLMTLVAQRTSRRSFLRGSGLVAATVLGASTLPLSGFEQAAKTPEGKKDGPQGGGPGGPGTENQERDKSEQDEFKVTKKDEQGRDYRVCPQCGYNMYRQDATWTCENCGYSYTE